MQELHLSENRTEEIFSILRWIFLCVGFILFCVPPFPSLVDFEFTTFPILISLGTTYMVIAQISLYKGRKNPGFFQFFCKAGIVFDYVAFMWLMILTGNVQSPFIPIAYLVIMHATIYWKTKGALWSSFSIFFGYLLVFLIFVDSYTFDIWLIYILNNIFIAIVGLIGVIMVLRERSHYEDKVKFKDQIMRDYLTGLFNHRCFQEQLSLYMNHRRKFAVVMGDIDDFKKINDQYGHQLGDKVLHSLGEVFSRVCSKYDVYPFRYGGEEFSFLIPNPSQTLFRQFFTEMYEQLGSLTFTENDLNVSMSFGVAISSSEDGKNENILQQADEQLYIGKNSGKNRVFLNNSEIFKGEN